MNGTNGDRVRLVELLELAEESVTFLTALAYADVMAGTCTPAVGAGRVAHVEGLAAGVRAALFAVDGAAPAEALGQVITEHKLRTHDGPGVAP
jgi:hypothetical protein